MSAVGRFGVRRFSVKRSCELAADCGLINCKLIMKKHIPNILTLMNLFAGCMAILHLLNGEWRLVPVFALIGLIGDAADGIVARTLGVHSPLGKELDSLADMVTFGVLPGAILYHLLATAYTGTFDYQGVVWAAIPGFIITMFSALRLAKFNIDERQTSDFIGLATPANTGFFVGLYLIVHFDTLIPGDWVLNLPLLYILGLVFSYFLISEIRMFGLKFNHWGWRGNELPYIFLITCVLLIVFLRLGAFSIGILTYLSIVLLDNVFLKKTK